MSIVREGFPFIIVPVALGILFLFFWRTGAATIAGSLFVALGVCSAFFFRDPTRTAPAGEALVISPADGTVMEVTGENGRKVVRIFLSVLNVHLQRAPISGTVKNVVYKPGKCLPAMHARAHIVNEQNDITILTPRGEEVVVTQIAGILARRVVSWVRSQDSVRTGQKIGLIKFGSQVDISLPDAAELNVKKGDKVRAGETVLGELR